MAKMGAKTIRSAKIEGLQVGKVFAKGEGACEMCEPFSFPSPPVASGSTATVGATAGGMPGLRG